MLCLISVRGWYLCCGECRSRRCEAHSLHTLKREGSVFKSFKTYIDVKEVRFKYEAMNYQGEQEKRLPAGSCAVCSLPLTVESFLLSSVSLQQDWTVCTQPGCSSGQLQSPWIIKSFTRYSSHRASYLDFIFNFTPKWTDGGRMCKFYTRVLFLWEDRRRWIPVQMYVHSGHYH